MYMHVYMVLLTTSCIQDPVGPSGADGLTFYFMMSTVLYGDVPIYAKGSNFIPMDAFVNRATPSFGRSILQSAVDGNQNMIRVWSVEQLLAMLPCITNIAKPLCHSDVK